MKRGFLLGLMCGACAAVVVYIATLLVSPATPSGALGAVPENASASNPHRGFTWLARSEAGVEREALAQRPVSERHEVVHQVSTEMLDSAKETGPVVRMSSLKRCLEDAELNPLGLACDDKELRARIERIIAATNEEIDSLRSGRESIRNAVFAAKMQSGLDGPETWAAIPRGEVVALMRQYQRVNGITQPEQGTVIRRSDLGEVPDFDAEMKRVFNNGRNEVRQLIASLCSKH